MNDYKNTQEWYVEWFNSPYYHVLYKNRNDDEAKYFIEKLISYLNPLNGAKIIDIACGKGRHSIYIAKNGYNVDGFDLSENNINEAKKSETSNLKFYINDIRTPLKINYYDYAFNLFTSFGYFDSEQENLKALKAIYKCLKPNGIFVLDYMNCNRVIKRLIQTETKTIKDITFNINRSYKNGCILKTISFSDKNKHYSYQEKVKVISLDKFKELFQQAGFTINNIFGDYTLSTFNEENSDRLILIASKND